MAEQGLRAQVRDTIRRLLTLRAPAATLCPSEVARALAREHWRDLMPQIREVAFDMARQGVLEIRQKGRTVSPDSTIRGPIRLGHPQGGQPG